MTLFLATSHNDRVAGVTNWYVKIGVTPTATEDEVRAAVEALSRKATAMANTAPERSQGLREQVRQIKATLLSGPTERAAYDATLAMTVSAGATAGTTAGATVAPALAQHLAQHPVPSAGPQPHPSLTPRPEPTVPPAVRPPGGTWGSKFKQFLQTGWSCPTCGEGALPNERTCRRCGTDIPQPALVTDFSLPQTPLRQPVQAPDTAADPCAGCGAVMGTGVRFCTRCGKPQTQS